MTAYDYNNLPQELNVEPLPNEMVADVRAAINEVLEYGITSASEVKAAYVYKRKGQMGFTKFGEQGNPHYASESDDIIMQLTVRVPNPKNVGRYGHEMKKLIEMEEQINAESLEVERARLEVEIAQAEEEAKTKRERLEELRNK